MALTYPYGIVAAADVDAAPIQGNFDAIKTYVDTLGAGAADTTWRTIRAGNGGTHLASSFGAGNYYLSAPATSSLTSMSAASAGATLLYLDDADVTLTGETPVLRLRVIFLTNATAPTVTYIGGLHELTAVAGGAAAIANTFNTTRVTDSGVTLTTPAASTRTIGVSGSFSVPSDGTYGFGMNISGAGAANSVFQPIFELQVKVAD